MRTDFRSRAALAGPSVLSAVLSFIALGMPSYWFDEAASLSAAGRPAGDLLRLLGNTDATHGIYYFLLHPLVMLGGTSEWVTRAPSAVFIVCATAGVTTLGWQLAGIRLASVAGFVFALLPITSHYGMETRSSALACALVCWASVTLVALIKANAQRRVVLWLGYMLLIVAAVLVFFLAVLVLASHVITVLLHRRRQANGRLMRRIVMFATAVLGLLVVLLLLFGRQSQQVSWIGPLSLHSIVASLQSWSVPHVMQPRFTTLTFWPLVAVLWALAATGVVRLFRARNQAEEGGHPQLLLSLALPWLLVPISALFLISLVHPIFTERYVFASTPAFALLVATGLLSLRTVWLRISVSVLALLLAIPVLILDRQSTAKGDLRLMAEVISEHRGPDDAIVFDPPPRSRALAAYPAEFSGMLNIGIAASAADSGTLAGTPASLHSIAGALRDKQGVWVIVNDPKSKRYRKIAALLSNAGLHMQEHWKLQETIQLWSTEPTSDSKG